MKRMLVLFLAFTLATQLTVPAWAETAPEETTEVTEAVEESEEQEKSPTDAATEPTETAVPTEEMPEEPQATEPAQEDLEETPAAFQDAEAPEEQYTIAFDPDGGSIRGEYPASYTPGSVIKLPKALKRGYRFLGWYEDGQAYTEISGDSTGDRHFTAQWEEKKTLTFDTTQQVRYYNGQTQSYSTIDISGQWVSSYRSSWGLPCIYLSVLEDFDGDYIVLETEMDSPVYAIHSGVVTDTSYSETDGYYVRILQGGNIFEYRSLSSCTVSAGQQIGVGEQLGSTKNERLCLRLFYSGRFVDPVGFFPNSNDWVSVAYLPGSMLNSEGWPAAPGTYDVHIMRQETEEYKAIDVYISSALIIKDIPHGRFDEGGTWVLEDGVLTIGEWVENYPTSENAPWAEYKADITELVIESYSKIGDYAFENLENLRVVTMCGNEGIGDYAFSGCSKLRKITFTEEIPDPISDTAFIGVQAEAHYTIGEYNRYAVYRLRDYGGKLTWAEHGEDARMLMFQGLTEWQVGEEFTLNVEASPYDATADCTYSVDKEGILEIQKASFRKCTFLAIAPGEVTVTATDKRTGLTVSCRIRTAVKEETKKIGCPYQITLQKGTGDVSGIHNFSFIPERSGYYVSILDKSGMKGRYIEWSVAENSDDYVEGVYYTEDDSKAKAVYYLVSGKSYTISINCSYWGDMDVAVFHWMYVSDQVQEIEMESAEIVLDVPPNGTGYGEMTVHMMPENAYHPIQWVSNSNCLEITEQSGGYCQFRLKCPGRTVLSAICGDKTASVSVIGRSPVELTEGQKVTLQGDTQYGRRYVAFRSMESGKYAFTVTGKNVSAYGGPYLYKSYGVDSQTIIVELNANETELLGANIGKGGTATVLVQKVTDPPQKLELICLRNHKNDVEIGTVFIPTNSYDRIVKWEIETPDVLGERSSHHSDNSIDLCPYKKGEATITATSESGLTASITLTVGQCFESHNYEVAEVVSPTCTAGGYTRSICRGCDRELIEDRIPALGHNLVLTEAKAPTYVEEGNNAYYVCVRCCKVYRDAEGTVETTVAAETLPRLEGPELDRSPRLGTAYVILNSNLLDGVSTALVESYGNTILSVAVYEYDKSIKGYSVQESTRFEAEAGDGTLTLSSREALKNGTYPLRLEVTCSIGSYSYELSVKVTNTLPKPTVKQTAKLNLFYKNSTAPLAVTVPGQTIENVELTDTEDFAIEPSENGWKIVYMTENPKPDTKGTLNISLEGYREPVKVALTVGTVSTAPTVKLSAASSTVNSGMDLTTQVRLLDKSGKPLELEDPSVDCGNADVDVDGNLLTITLNEAKSTTVTMYLQDSTWAKAIKLTHKVNVSNKKPTLKPAGSLTLSSLFTARTAETAMVLSQSNLTVEDVDFVSTAKAGSAAWTEAQKLELRYDGGYVTAKITDPENAPKAGTYSFKCTGTLETEETVPGGTLKVIVSAAAPKIKLSATSVKLNKFLAGKEQGSVQVTAPNGYQVADFEGMREGMTFDADTGILTAALEDASDNGGTCNLYPVVRDVETGEEVELSTKLSFKVQAYNSQKLGVSLSAKGKLDTQKDGEITYTVTKLTNCLGTVKSMDLGGQDAELFQTSVDYVNGKATVHLTLKDGETYATNRSYKVQFKFYACGQEILSPVQTVKITQTALKVTAPKTITYYQAQKSPLRCTLTANLSLDAVTLNSKTAKEFREAVGDVTLDGNRLEFQIAVPGALKAGKSYAVILDAKPENNAENVKPVTVKLTVKVQK